MQTHTAKFTRPEAPFPTKQERPEDILLGSFLFYSRQRPTLPQSHPCSTIGAGELNYRVRDGNGCGLSAIVTGKSISSKPVAPMSLEP
jgi:hypothetical protein